MVWWKKNVETLDGCRGIGGSRVELAGGMTDLETRMVVWHLGKGALSSSHISDSGGATAQRIRLEWGGG